MVSNRLPFIALAVACIGAAAGGGYLATRQNVVPAPTSAEQLSTPSAGTADVPGGSVPPAAGTPTGAPASDAVPPATRGGTAVQETEAVVGDRPAAKPEPPAAVTKSAPSRRADAPPAPERRSRPPVGQTARREPAPTLSGSWPSGAGSQPPVTPAEPPATHAEERATPEPTRAPEPPQRAFEELVVSAESVLGLQTDNRITSETARVEDRVDARVTRDVRVGDRVAIPAGTRAIGSVMQVDRGGKFKERARLGIRFHTLVLADGTRLQISTETIYRDGEPPGNGSAAKVGGGAVGGAILGAILGGAKGAVIGGSAGAGAGTAAVMASDRNAATFPAGTPMTVRILSPVTVTTEK
jgi:hypothetical protein